MKEGTGNQKESEKERQRRESDYARSGTSHGYRHENTATVRQTAKTCNRDCANCPVSKTCTK